MKNKLSFLLTFISMIGLFALAWFKGTDIETMLPTILGMYILGRAGSKISYVWAASKDPNADTVSAIEKAENISNN